MIYQFKVALLNIKPPVWRRLQIDGETSFKQLHKILQIAFDWEDYHLHGFFVRKTNQESLQHPYISIGPKDPDAGCSDFDYEESSQKISDWFKAEKDKIVYIYDFGDNWKHEIVLEKIFSPEPNVLYPLCIKVMREAPEEDCGRSIEIGGTSRNDEMKDSINLAFRQLTSKSQATTQPQPLTTEHKQHGWSRLFSLSDEFKALKPWKWMDDDQIFAIQDPKNEEYLYCSVMGAAGMEYGLAVFIGNEGLKYLNKLIQEDVSDITYLEQRSLLLSFSDRGDLSPEDYALIKEQNLSYRGKQQWPQFRSFMPGFYPWLLTDDEVELFITTLEQTIQICKQAQMEPSLLKWNGNSFVTRIYHSKTGLWENRKMNHTIVANKKDVPLYVNELEVQSVRNGSKRFNVPLEFDLSVGPTPIQEQKGERPYFPYLALCIERKQGMIIYHEFVKGHKSEETIQKALLAFVQKLNILPREIWIKEDLYPALKPLAAKLKINLLVVRHLPLLEQAKKEMFSFFRKI